MMMTMIILTNLIDVNLLKLEVGVACVLASCYRCYMTSQNLALIWFLYCLCLFIAFSSLAFHAPREGKLMTRDGVQTEIRSRKDSDYISQDN